MRPVRCESGHAKTEHVFGTPTFLAATQALVLSEQGLKCVAPLSVAVQGVLVYLSFPVKVLAAASKLTVVKRVARFLIEIVTCWRCELCATRCELREL